MPHLTPLTYLSTDDYRATGDGVIAWYRAVDGAEYGVTNAGAVLDRDGCPLTNDQERGVVLAAVSAPATQ
jgi:hypothetical protein